MAFSSVSSHKFRSFLTVLGIVIGFGAQALIRDLLSGIFLLFEGLVAVGDEIQVGAATGAVESIGLRVTKLRLPDGALRVVPQLFKPNLRR